MPTIELRHARCAPQERLPIFGGLVGVVPPDGRETRLPVFRRLRRTTEAIPARGADLVVGPLRHHEVVPQQHAIQRLGRSDEIVAVLGEDHAIDQLVDRRILDADDVAGAGHIGSLRAPEFTLLVTGRQRLRPGRHDDVKIPGPQPVLILRGIDGADRHADAETFERWLEEQHHALKRGILAEQFQLKRRTGLGIDQFAITDFVARFLEQLQRFAKIAAHIFSTATDRIRIGLGENLRRHFGTHRLQNLQLLAFRQARGRKLGAVEIAGDALVLAEEDLLVHLLEVERIVQRATNARILELVAANVEREALHDARRAIEEFFEDDALLGHRRKVIGRRPVLRRYSRCANPPGRP